MGFLSNKLWPLFPEGFVNQTYPLVLVAGFLPTSVEQWLAYQVRQLAAFKVEWLLLQRLTSSPWLESHSS